MTKDEFLRSVRPGDALVMRGVAGAGKSSLVQALGVLVPRIAVSSADKHRMVDGKYVFDPAKNHLAHAGCLRDFIASAQMGHHGSPVDIYDVIVCDNTNCSADEAMPYIKIAAAYGWNPILVTINIEPEVAAARNQHNVPANHVARMSERLRRASFPRSIYHVKIP